jgi:hypothetical protein
VNIVSFSGGRTSAYLVHLMLQRDPDCKIVFCDTGAEHPKTYEFIKDMVKHWDIDITCLRCVVHPEHGIGNTYQELSIDEIGCNLKPFKAMIEKYSTPFIHGAFCTERMKTVPFYKYCNDVYGRNSYTTWLGIRIDEPRRLKEKKGIKYLADISDFEKVDILNWWKRQPFDLQIQEHLGNCVFCIKKGVNKLALAAKDEPELAAEFIKMINSKTVPEKRETPKEIIYRGHNSLESIIATFKNVARTEIARGLKNAHRYDSGSCSESCEAIQMDMFKEVV